ncbi:DeoR/GlpR family DNA-binding transcription regulator [Deinococcus daejeonensis]|uniref:DeoR family transcriptional regulator n=1 Tax=Deinococcus daejeonensis TaxID=1007098 RepID=A0ABQ2IX38_9DEIO|nr:DeoR/GlpR family DNA-binding transcription regulator [Deinococcus daejeonensis]GGN29151.1 DeoR family transcriptional regulator [Deinococcus daejeonensis]
MIEGRRSEIVALVRQHGELSVTELSGLLGVSEVTVRSDLSALAQAGHVRRTRGRVSLPLDLRREAPLETSMREFAAAKRRIGQAAAALVRSGDTVFLDVGSTTSEVARALSPSLQDVTVVTNGLNIALLLERLPGVRVIVTGGTLRPLQHSLVSPYALDVLRHIHADRLFLGCNGVHPASGVTNANHEEAEVKRLMAEQAREVVVVADHRKLGVVSRAFISPLDRVTTLITDRAATPPPPDVLDAVKDVRVV